MENDYWRHISTISVNYIQGKTYYVYLSNVASGLDARISSSYIVGDISPTLVIGSRSKNTNYGTPVSISKVHLLVRVLQHQILVFLKTKYIDIVIIFIIALSDNQWTVEWHTWLSYKTNQFHVQHDFLFSKNIGVFQRSQILIIAKKCCQRKWFW